jgi:uncharacterized damage-inducible protein DinB
MNSIQAISQEVLHDLDSLLIQLSPEIYGQSLPVLSGATLGQHVRHVLEGYQSLARSLADGGLLDYEARPRDRRLETDLALARSVLREVKIKFAEVPPEQPLTLRHTHGTDAPLTVPTNVGRELLYNVEHAIHHMALLRIGVEQAVPTIALPSHFGVASATIRHRQSA